MTTAAGTLEDFVNFLHNLHHLVRLDGNDDDVTLTNYIPVRGGDIDPQALWNKTERGVGGWGGGGGGGRSGGK